MKKIIPAFIFVVVCQAAFAQESENVSTAKKIFKAFNNHNWSGMLSYYAKNAVFEDPSFAAPVADHDVVLKHHLEMAEYFPDIHDEIKVIYPSGANVIIEFVATGTSVQGKKFTLPICAVLTFKDGKVVRDATYYDVTP